MVGPSGAGAERQHGGHTVAPRWRPPLSSLSHSSVSLTTFETFPARIQHAARSPVGSGSNPKPRRAVAGFSAHAAAPRAQMRGQQQRSHRSHQQCGGRCCRQQQRRQPGCFHSLSGRQGGGGTAADGDESGPDRVWRCRGRHRCISCSVWGSARGSSWRQRGAVMAGLVASRAC